MAVEKQIVVGASGASGMPLLIKCLEILQDNEEYRSLLVMSRSAKLTLEQETDWSVSQVEALADEVLDPDNIGAGPASGSYRTEGMVIVPCSMKTAAGIVSGYTDNLLLRAADVTIKEKRPLVLAARDNGRFRMCDNTVDDHQLIQRILSGLLYIKCRMHTYIIHTHGVDFLCSSFQILYRDHVDHDFSIVFLCGLHSAQNGFIVARSQNGNDIRSGFKCCFRFQFSCIHNFRIRQNFDFREMLFKLSYRTHALLDDKRCSHLCNINAASCFLQQGHAFLQCQCIQCQL